MEAMIINVVWFTYEEYKQNNESGYLELNSEADTPKIMGWNEKIAPVNAVRIEHTQTIR